MSPAAISKVTYNKGQAEITLRTRVMRQITHDLPERIHVAFGEEWLEASVKRAPHGRGSHHGAEGKRSFGAAVAGGGHAGGNLKRSLTTEVSRVAKGILLILFGTCGYSGYVEIGTGLYGPHKAYIKPKSKPFLAWEDPFGGWRHAKKVKGRPATPFIKPGFDSTQQRMDSIAEKEYKKLERATRETSA